MFSKCLVLILAGLFFSCQNPGANQGNFPPLPIDEVQEDQLFDRLSGSLFPNATDPAVQAQNELINYALDNKLDVHATGSGLYVWVIDPGTGTPITSSSTVKADYIGRLLDGTIFDSSFSRGKPIEFRVGQMIQGWNEGITMLRKGGRAVLLIPPALAYGADGIKDRQGRVVVPANAVLRFDLLVLPDEESR